MKAHRTDTVSLTFALIFLGLVGWWLVAQVVNLPLPQVGWVLAAALILLGVLGLVSALRTGRGGRPAPGPDQPEATTRTVQPDAATGPAHPGTETGPAHRGTAGTDVPGPGTPGAA